MSKKPYISKEQRAILEAARLDIIDKAMADKDMPDEVKKLISSMSLEEMLSFMDIETQKPKSDDVDAPITFLPAVTRTPT